MRLVSGNPVTRIDNYSGVRLSSGLTIPEGYVQPGRHGCYGACMAFVDSYLGQRVTTPAMMDAALSIDSDEEPFDVDKADVWALQQGHAIDYAYSPFISKILIPFQKGEVSREVLNASRTALYGGDSSAIDSEQYDNKIRAEYPQFRADLQPYLETGQCVEYDFDPLSRRELLGIINRCRAVIAMTKIPNRDNSHAVTFVKPLGLPTLLYHPYSNASIVRKATRRDFSMLHYFEGFTAFR